MRGIGRIGTLSGDSPRLPQILQPLEVVLRFEIAPHSILGQRVDHFPKRQVREFSGTRPREAFPSL